MIKIKPALDKRRHQTVSFSFSIRAADSILAGVVEVLPEAAK